MKKIMFVTMSLDQFHGHFHHRAAIFHIISDVFMVTVFGKIASKYDTWCKSCNIKYEVKYQHKCWWNQTTSFALFTLL